ncbi:hypothetical protein ACJ70E_20845 [Pseudomonas plecoglossicida]|uniref:hypothetical protein n=1 Tax=Pseudomonas plecoglossicida TaxID=70775 RepID=UPI00397769E4
MVIHTRSPYVEATRRGLLRRKVTAVLPVSALLRAESEPGKVGVDDATCAAGIGCLVSSYRKNHDRKKHFYDFLKFIFPIDEEALAATPEGTTVKSHTLYSR